MTTSPLAVGDRVVYRDPQDPRHPLAGEVVDVTEHAVRVRYDAHPHAPGLVGREQAASVLQLEDVR